MIINLKLNLWFISRNALEDFEHILHVKISFNKDYGCDLDVLSSTIAP